MPGALRGTCYPTLPSAQKHVVGHGNYLRDLFCKKACEMMGGAVSVIKVGFIFPTFYILPPHPQITSKTSSTELARKMRSISTHVQLLPDTMPHSSS